MKIVWDNKKFQKDMNNLVAYANGFVDGVNIGKPALMSKIGPRIAEILGEYIDANARMNPQKLQHVYEWYQSGSEGGRLFDIQYSKVGGGLTFNYSFRQSSSIQNGSNVPFYDKARIMEQGIPVTIKPINSKVLAFKDGIEEVFTKNPVSVSNPGGSMAQGGFVETFKEFFLVYMSQAFLDSTGLKQYLSTPSEFKNSLAAGIAAGRPAGVKAGTKWISGAGEI